MTTNSDLTAALERARHALALLEAQAAGYTVQTIPVHLQIELEEKRREVADLAARLGLPPTPPLNPDHLAAYREALRAQCARLETRPYQQRAELRGAPPSLTLLETYEPRRPAAPGAAPAAGGTRRAPGRGATRTRPAGRGPARNTR